LVLEDEVATQIVSNKCRNSRISVAKIFSGKQPVCHTISN